MSDHDTDCPDHTELSEPMKNTFMGMAAHQPEDSVVMLAKSTDEHPRVLLALTLGEHPEVAVSFDDGVDTRSAMLPYERLIAGLIASQQPGHVERVSLASGPDAQELMQSIGADAIRAMIGESATEVVNSQLPRYSTTGFIRLEENSRPLAYFIDLEIGACGVRTPNLTTQERDEARKLVTSMVEGLGIDGHIRKRDGYPEGVVFTPEDTPEVMKWIGWAP